MKSLVLLSLLAFCQVVAAQQIMAEAVWIDYAEKQHHIYFSRFNGEAWESSDDPVYSSDNPLTSPTLGTSPDGRKTLIWTEQRRLKAVLMSMQSETASVQKEETLVWSEANLFSDFGVENFAASLLYDFSGQAWVFWSASRGGLSDVFVSRSSGFGWSKPEQVNSVNKAPDTGPHARIDDSGHIIVTWSTFDFDIDSYRQESKAFLQKGAVRQSTEPEENKDLLPQDIPVPTFLPDNRASVIHFPTNRRLQTVVMQGR